MKKLFYLVILLMTILILLSGWYIWQNNRYTDLPSQTEIKQHFDRSVNWLNLNYSSIEGIQNPILWWMINQAGLNSNDETLINIYSNYKKDHVDKMPEIYGRPSLIKTIAPMCQISFSFRTWQTISCLSYMV